METEEETVSQVVRQAERRGAGGVQRFGDRRGAEQGFFFRWRGMETETKQRQDINQGNATAWQTANNTTRKRKNKRETEISVRGAAAVCRRGGESLLELLAASEGREEI